MNRQKGVILKKWVMVSLSLFSSSFIEKLANGLIPTKEMTWLLKVDYYSEETMLQYNYILAMSFTKICPVHFIFTLHTFKALH